MIFNLGDLVYEHRDGHTRLFQVRRHGYGESPTGGRGVGGISTSAASFVSFDGFKTGIASEKLRIWETRGFFGLFSTSITSLSAFPVKFLGSEARTDLEIKLADRG
ncbi:hypothetical protein B2J93_7629 [Marssonina coronariae]|uniref:DUF7025 domain-containing protein n=1 Tax=Diplocarpon coronariae TaxID=2795749 RepID=A0A218Z6A3_9HELO|nr:hypothetical protein B2J93_7629 [Marssonina coronariae]